ncbi:MAG TPA: protein kinase [Ignavibacteriaceae bacterium]|nr:protein kinase [Ignavibacteriaceae bacterium]
MNNLIGQTVLHYKIVDKLGEGGMGIVYKAEDTKLKREVAIKFLPRQISADTEERQRFEIEAQAAAALNHPNITTIYSIENSGDEIFIVMEFINGIELKEKIKKEPLSLNDSLKIMEQIASGLDIAHKKGITHRDIKTSNIMITQSSGLVKIMDFGLAKIGGSSQITKIGTTIGTAAYMSPEQAQGDKADHRTDIWAMGVIFYEMLTGQQPFKGEFEQAVIYSILNVEPDPITKVKSDIPLAIENISKKMLSKNQDLRYQDISSFLSDLKKTQNKKSDKMDQTEKTIAVLPFANISPDKEADYFADGLAEELITNLSRIKEIKLTARTNTMKYKGTDKDIKSLGQELGARYIMQGSVRKYNDDLRISVQLMDVAQEKQLWGETYKGKLAEVFDIQEQVSKQIADMLMVKLSPIEKIGLTKRATENTEAFDYYLRARDFLYRISKNNLQFAIQLFTKAIEIDKRYAAAYAGLSEGYANSYLFFERSNDLLEKSIEAGLKALMYDPSLSEAYAALALAYFNKNMQDEAFTSGQKAIELDNNNYTAYWILGRIFHSTDRDEEAIELYKKVISLNPDFYSAYMDLRTCYERLGNKEEYNKILKTAVEFFPRYLSEHPDDARAHIIFANDLAQVGDLENAKLEGKKAFELSPNDSLMLYNVACLYSRLNDKDSSIEYLKKAISTGYSNYEWIKRDSDFDNIRNEPGYIVLMKGK